MPSKEPKAQIYGTNNFLFLDIRRNFALCKGTHFLRNSEIIAKKLCLPAPGGPKPIE